MKAATDVTETLGMIIHSWKHYKGVNIPLLITKRGKAR